MCTTTCSALKDIPNFGWQSKRIIIMHYIWPSRNKICFKNWTFEYLLYNTNLKWWTGNILRVKPKIKFIFSTFRTDIVNFWYSIFFLAHWNFSQGSTDRLERIGPLGTERIAWSARTNFSVRGSLTSALLGPSTKSDSSPRPESRKSTKIELCLFRQPLFRPSPYTLTFDGLSP